MLSLALLAAAAATSAPATDLSINAPWWERVTVTIAGDGKTQGCEYRTSSGEKSNDCKVDAGVATKDGASNDSLTRITFERRFTPGAAPSAGEAPVGETLLGKQVMALIIDANGAVRGCKVVETSGDMTPNYGCAEARAEKFNASASRDGEAGQTYQGHITVMAYGRSENIA